VIASAVFCIVVNSDRFPERGLGRDFALKDLSKDENLVQSAKTGSRLRMVVATPR